MATAGTLSPDVHQNRPRERHQSGGDSKFHRRTSRHDLWLDFSRIPVYTGKAYPIRDKTEEEGCMLYRDFLRARLDLKGLRAPNQSILTPADRVTYSCRNPDWVILRREILHMANSFERTKQRNAILRQCQQVDLLTMEEDLFCDQLKTMFANGEKSRNNILVLFVFTTDLMVHALDKDNQEQFDLLLKWTLDFITQDVCPWVRENGGWDKVLDNSFQHFPKIVAAATIALLAVMSYRWLSKRL